MGRRALAAALGVGWLVSGVAARANEACLRPGAFPAACDIERGDTIRVLYLMANQVAALPTGPENRGDAAALVRTSADLLSHAQPTDLQSPELRQGLAAALSVLEQIQHPSPNLTAKIALARLALEQIDPGVPWAQQPSNIGAAMRAVLDALQSADAEARVLEAEHRAVEEQAAQAAGAPVGPAPIVPATQVVVLRRWGFDQAGPQPDVARACGGRDASHIELKRTPVQVTLGIVTVGMYTPVTAYITCAGTPTSASR
jgi:hypothetical protein